MRRLALSFRLELVLALVLLAQLIVKPAAGQCYCGISFSQTITATACDTCNVELTTSNIAVTIQSNTVNFIYSTSALSGITGWTLAMALNTPSRCPKKSPWCCPSNINNSLSVLPSS